MADGDVAVNLDAPVDINSEHVDPGSLEGTRGKVDPRSAQDSITEDHPRFKEIYGKLKGTERELESFKKEKETSNKLIDEMRRHNQELAKRIDGVEKAKSAPAEDKGPTKEELQGKIKDLNIQKAKALETFKYSEVTELDEQIFDLKIQIKEIGTKKVEKETVRSEEKHTDEGGLTEENQEIMEAFTKETDWYNPKSDSYDPIMVGAAHTLDMILSADKVWGKKSFEDRIQEVKSRVEKKFGIEEKKGADFVEGETGGSNQRGGGRQRTGSVTLTKEQVDLASAFFPDLTREQAAKEYAKQM